MRRVVTVLAAAFVATIAFAAPAFAHVTVNPKEAAAGSYARVAFRVPNESDDTTTTKLEVHMPQNAPIASVSTMPVPGWTVEVAKRKLDKPLEMHGSQVSEVVSVITWTVSSPEAAVKPGQFQEFPVSMGAIPGDVDQLVFKALQTYSDGAVVRWIEEPKEGAELEHPAPVLKVVKADGTSSAAPVAQPQPSSGNNIFGWASLAVAVAALLLAAFAVTRSRRMPE